ncbi:receptor kinase-like protein Xa21 isoform X2 [Ricinus communis]|uniref:receptor kinase-like protein Xa21 isoform X2 n=1 Tax=Ricinus communis TaxID=3988 RepID=UPI0007722DC4|nr:receptor kinase-like protein Xa21 isoform X2 [Ricinus communis]|eukprot:XP_015579442.1 receptor kinase-like protein Xa21 isoform X1 [Ricinus communis]
MYIALSDNQLHNAIPLGVENLLNLRFFLFDRNYLSGPIVVDFKNFSRLEMLDLQGNNFTGTIPISISNLSMLSNLYLGFNNLYGSIPSSLGSCHNLIELDLSYNRLTGSIPGQVIGLSSLSILLNLGFNGLTGPIPSEVGSLQKLAELDLSNNRLSGMIPDTIGKCLSLEQLHLEGNSFSGEIPQLRGEVPERGIFLNASAVSLLGNNSFCGGITELKLPSCPFTNSKKKNLTLALKVIIPVVVFAIFLAGFVFFSIFWHQKRMSRKKNISTPSFEHKFLRISYTELFKATDGFSKANIIGVGSYGSVYRGTLEQEGIEVAVKVLNMQQRGASSSFMSECQALRSIRHRNLLKLLSVCSSIDYEENDFKALIYEFMVNGSLEKWLHAGEGTEQRELGNPKLMQRLNIAIDIASAIEYLHNGSSSAIIHGDLKPSNVLLDDEMTAHIGDFGLAKVISSMSIETQPHGSSSIAIRGSVGYVAPEYGMSDSVSIEGDVYSYGILLLEMFTGKKPTDESFKDDLNLHTFIERSLHDKVMDIVDVRIVSEDDAGRFSKDSIIYALRIGVACSIEQPGDRMKMRDVIKELQKCQRLLLN